MYTRTYIFIYEINNVEYAMKFSSLDPFPYQLVLFASSPDVAHTHKHTLLDNEGRGLDWNEQPFWLRSLIALL